MAIATVLCDLAVHDAVPLRCCTRLPRMCQVFQLVLQHSLLLTILYSWH